MVVSCTHFQGSPSAYSAFKGGGGASSKILTSLLIHRQPPSEHCRDPGLHQCPSSWEGGIRRVLEHVLDAGEQAQQ